MFFGATSCRMSSASCCRRQRLRMATATARFASSWPTMWRSNSATISRGVKSGTICMSSNYSSDPAMRKSGRSGYRIFHPKVVENCPKLVAEYVNQSVDYSRNAGHCSTPAEVNQQSEPLVSQTEIRRSSFWKTDSRRFPSNLTSPKVPRLLIVCKVRFNIPPSFQLAKLIPDATKAILSRCPKLSHQLSCESPSGSPSTLVQMVACTCTLLLLPLCQSRSGINNPRPTY